MSQSHEASTAERLLFPGLLPTYSHLRLVPYLSSTNGRNTSATTPSMRFPTIERSIPEGVFARVGRYTERSGRHQRDQRQAIADGLKAIHEARTLLAEDQTHGQEKYTMPPSSLVVEDILFKSKVVSRSHAEIWVEEGKFFIRDTASSSGTFLNNMRLSPQGVRSDAHRLRDGDCLQLGVEYHGGEEEANRCVRMRVELNRRSAANTALRLATLTALAEAQIGARASNLSPSSPPTSATETHVPMEPVTTDCCICLLPLRRTPLFLTPCAHAFHYACVRPMLSTRRMRNGRPLYDAVDGFTCPMCRSYIDLMAEPADEEDDVMELAEMTTIGMSLGARRPASDNAVSTDSPSPPMPAQPDMGSNTNTSSSSSSNDLSSATNQDCQLILTPNTNMASIAMLAATPSMATASSATLLGKAVNTRPSSQPEDTLQNETEVGASNTLTEAGDSGATNPGI